MSEVIMLNISKIEDLSGPDRSAFYGLSGFGYWSPTQVWTWAGGGFAILGIKPGNGPMESWVYWRLSDSPGERYHSRIFHGCKGIGPLLKSYGFDSEVVDPNPDFEYQDTEVPKVTPLPELAEFFVI